MLALLYCDPKAPLSVPGSGFRVAAITGEVSLENSSWTGSGELNRHRQGGMK